MHSFIVKSLQTALPAERLRHRRDGVPPLRLAQHFRHVVQGVIGLGDPGAKRPRVEQRQRLLHPQSDAPLQAGSRGQGAPQGLDFNINSMCLSWGSPPFNMPKYHMKRTF